MKESKLSRKALSFLCIQSNYSVLSKKLWKSTLVPLLPTVSMSLYLYPLFIRCSWSTKENKGWRFPRPEWDRLKTESEYCPPLSVTYSVHSFLILSMEKTTTMIMTLRMIINFLCEWAICFGGCFEECYILNWIKVMSFGFEKGNIWLNRKDIIVMNLKFKKVFIWLQK